jgi:hypothetical protein
MRRRLLVAALLGAAVVGGPAAPAHACHTYLHCVVETVVCDLLGIGCEPGTRCFRTSDVEFCV